MNSNKCPQCGSQLVWKNRGTSVKIIGTVILILVTVLSGFTLLIPALIFGVLFYVWTSKVYEGGYWSCPNCDKN